MDSRFEMCFYIEEQEEIESKSARAARYAAKIQEALDYLARNTRQEKSISQRADAVERIQKWARKAAEEARDVDISAGQHLRFVGDEAFYQYGVGGMITGLRKAIAVLNAAVELYTAPVTEETLKVYFSKLS